MTEKKSITKKMQIFLSLECLFYSGFVSVFLNWMPTFSLMLKILNKNNAALIVSLNCFTQTIIRAIFIFVSTNTITVLDISCFIYLMFGPVSFALYFIGFKLVLVYTMTFIFSISMVLYFPYLYALPEVFNMRITAENSAQMMISYAIGEAIISPFVGFFMGAFHPMAMVVNMTVITVIVFVFYRLILREMRKTKNEEETQNEPQEVGMASEGDLKNVKELS